MKNSKITFSYFTEAGPPEDVNMTCQYDNVSRTGFVHVSWSQPKNPNGEIDHYNVSCSIRR